MSSSPILGRREDLMAVAHEYLFRTHLVTVSLQVVKDIAASFSHVRFASVYHLLVNVRTLSRNDQSGADVQILVKRCERKLHCFREKTVMKKVQQNRTHKRISPTWWSSLAFVWPPQRGCLHHLLLISAPLFQHNSLFRYPWWLGCRPNHSLPGLQGKGIIYTLK